MASGLGTGREGCDAEVVEACFSKFGDTCGSPAGNLCSHCSRSFQEATGEPCWPRQGTGVSKGRTQSRAISSDLRGRKKKILMR